MSQPQLLAYSAGNRRRGPRNPKRHLAAPHCAAPSRFHWV